MDYEAAIRSAESIDAQRVARPFSGWSDWIRERCAVGVFAGGFD